MTSPLIEVQDLVKVYPARDRRDEKLAVDRISFVVDQGEIFGFLGPNGAGKTTTVNVLTTLIRKTSGVVRVAGYNADGEAESIRSRIGYAQQSTPGVTTLDVDFTVRQNLMLQAELYGIAPPERRVRVDEVVEALGLAEVVDKGVRTVSGGFARRVEIACALVHRPILLFLDEPTTGLDPHSRRALWDLLIEKKLAGTTIFLTTQYMEEADKLAGRVAIISEGNIVASGTPAQLKSTVGGDVVTVTLPDEVSQGTVFRAVEVLKGIWSDVTFSDHAVILVVEKASESLSSIALRLNEAGVPIAGLGYSQATLDDVFLHYTGERIKTNGGQR